MLVQGTFIHAPTPGDVEIVDNALISVDRTGTIAEVLAGTPTPLISNPASNGDLDTSQRRSSGIAYDAIVVDTRIADSNLVTWYGLGTPDDILKKIIYNAGRRNISRARVEDREVAGYSSSA